MSQQSQPRRSKLVRTKGEDYVPPGTKLARTRGRPSEFDPYYIERAKELSAGGATVAEIAEDFGRPERTIWRWMAENPDFHQAIKTGGAPFDDRVEMTLGAKALAGDTTAQIFWLKNRRPNQWRDKRDVELGGAVDITDNTSRSLALAALALIRQAVEEPNEGVVIEHQEAAE